MTTYFYLCCHRPHKLYALKSIVRKMYQQVGRLSFRDYEDLLRKEIGYSVLKIQQILKTNIKRNTGIDHQGEFTH